MRNFRIIRVIINTKDYKHLENEVYFTFDGSKVHKGYERILLADEYPFPQYLSDLKEVYNL